jgi:hypothetical protein
MKTRIFSVLAIALLFAFSSCEDDLLDITEEFSYESEILVFTTDTVASAIEIVDMTESSTIIDEYQDKIKTIEITDVEYWITFHEGSDEQSIIEASLNIGNETGGDQQLIAEITNKNLKELLDVPTQLEVQQAGLDKMSDLIKNDPHKFSINYNTACNEGPLNFRVKFKFTIKMVANPLN